MKLEQEMQYTIYSHQYWMDKAIQYICNGDNEVPVCALVVKDNKLISIATNKVESQNDPTAHAEILAIREASNILSNWRLNGCTLYVTLEPCTMCKGAITNSRISTLVFGAYDTSNLITRHCEERSDEAISLRKTSIDCFVRTEVLPRNDMNIEIIGGILGLEAGALLKDFFLARR